ncbi:MAG TPA: ATP-binding protein [Magnetospirillaceae bacterium]
MPIVLMTQHGHGVERNPIAARLAENLGNVTFIERPFHSTTLISIVAAAVRSRRRQYEARSRLEQLSEGERRLQTALTAGHLGSWIVDVPTMTLHVSDSGRAHFGRSPGDPFSFDDLEKSVHPEDRARRREAIELTLRTGADYIIEYRTIWPDRSVHWIDVHARAIKSPAGAVSQLVGVTTDITVRKTSELEQTRLLNELAAERAALSVLTATLEQRVEQRTVELMAEVTAREKAQKQLLQSQKMEAVGQLTGGVAHDFNNLLMAVMGNLEVLSHRLANDPRAKRLIEGAIEGVERGASLTQRMLAFARQQDLKTGPVDLSALLSGMHDLLGRSLGPNIALFLRADKTLLPAQVDAQQVELAILNLAINARDAMPDGGTITISLDQETVNAKTGLRKGSYLRVRVSDNGCGMDATTLSKAVEPFFSTKPLGKGTGLGLSMVHGLAVQLGGLLELSSEVNKGTDATLWLPAAEQPLPSKKKPAPEKPKVVAPSHLATILVVDDDPLISTSTVQMLEDLGHAAIWADSGQRALEILEEGHAIDLMLTDQSMPGMTGIELAEIVLSKHPSLPVLLTTGYADLPLGERTELPRLSKPYRQAQLEAMISKLLRGIRLSEAIGADAATEHL